MVSLKRRLYLHKPVTIMVNVGKSQYHLPKDIFAAVAMTGLRMTSASSSQLERSPASLDDENMLLGQSLKLISNRGAVSPRSVTNYIMTVTATGTSIKLG